MHCCTIARNRQGSCAEVTVDTRHWCVALARWEVRRKAAYCAYGFRVFNRVGGLLLGPVQTKKQLNVAAEWPPAHSPWRNSDENPDTHSAVARCH